VPVKGGGANKGDLGGSTSPKRKPGTIGRRTKRGAYATGCHGTRIPDESKITPFRQQENRSTPGERSVGLVLEKREVSARAEE